MQEIHKDPNTIHYSVLKDESVRSLNLKEGLTVVDATVNRGGHAVEIAKQIGKSGTLIIFDLDKDALRFSENRLKGLENSPNVIAIHSNYRDIKEKLSEVGIMSIDRVFADLGLSSQELEVSGRGFTFQKDEPLYMTYQSEVTSKTFTASDLLNNLSVSNLEKIFQVYGDVPNAWKIANAIVEKRQELEDIKKKISTTKQLVNIIESVNPRKGKIHPATKVFQAIRIAVNDEFEGIKEFINDSYQMLSPGGVISIITFHSGEDRIVKKVLKSYETKTNKQSKVKPGRKEILENKRSRSAILRTITKEI
jgi:16S rRNA (cytosine1402-N4)-methyltransferase